MRIPFTSKTGVPGYVDGEPGTNFGLRIDAAEVERLLNWYGETLPFEIMAAGYGGDEDWCGIYVDDLDEDDLVLKDPEGWAPYEVDGGPEFAQLRKPTSAEIKQARKVGYAIGCWGV